MQLKGKKVFITGGSGFIGSHLVEELVKEGSSVTVVVHYNSRNNYGNLEYLDKDILKQINIIKGDITDYPFLIATTKGIDIIFHLAALIAIPYSYIAPQSYVSTNINGTLNILECGRINEIEKILITSTSETYGSARYTPIDENHPLQAQSPYAATKIGADKLAESYFKSFNLPVVTIRPFNTYGPRQSARAVIPSIIIQALQNNRIKLGSLKPIRDFTFVKDTAKAYVLSAKANNIFGKVINFGSGKGVSIKEVKDIISKIIGKKIIVQEDKNRIRPLKSEVNCLICNSKLAKKLTGWSPKYSLEDGLKETVAYISKHMDLYKTDIYNV